MPTNPNSNRGRYANGRPCTLGDLARQQDGGRSDDDDDRNNRLYTGNNLFVDSNPPPGQGGDGPAAGGGDLRRAQMLRDLMSRAAEQGQEEDGQQSTNFSGTGYTLGDDGVERQVIRGEVTRHMTIWRNGLTLDDDGTFHELGDDPRQLRILHRLRQGIAPTEWLNVEPGEAVRLVLTDNSSRDYSPIAAAAMQGKAPKKTYFNGEGMRLDSALAASAAAAAASGSTVGVTATPSVSTPPLQQQSGPAEPEIDRTGDVLSIRLMLPSGARTVQFNATHSTEYLYEYVGQVESSDGFELTTPPHEVVPRSADVQLGDLPDLRRGAVRFYRPK